jgi:hypothetical protein
MIRCFIAKTQKDSQPGRETDINGGMKQKQTRRERERMAEAGEEEERMEEEQVKSGGERSVGGYTWSMHHCA